MPYAGPPIGLALDVPAILEVVDHVLPGLVVIVAAIAGITRSPGATLPFAASMAATLGGLWMTATHVPLLFQAASGLAPWGAALFHSLPSIAVFVLALLWLVTELRVEPAAEAES